MRYATFGKARDDPECDLDYVANEMREATINIALSDSFGFGGKDAILAFKKID